MRAHHVVVAWAAAATVLAGCASPGETPAPSTPRSTETGGGHGSYASCLDQHGVPAPAGPVSGPPPGVDVDTWESAMAECSSLAPGPAG
ncbi:hypothetical protein CRI77_04340 [Mycolicibacterium duvalii]|nr:hypothetical protein [Mycolicibacterium duvalii]PEG43812.1 hypothetical protein CRI77_04340 [Mycolicibacterium duvalii]